MFISIALKQSNTKQFPSNIVSYHLFAYFQFKNTPVFFSRQQMQKFIKFVRFVMPYEHEFFSFFFKYEMSLRIFDLLTRQNTKLLVLNKNELKIENSQRGKTRTEGRTCKNSLSKLKLMQANLNGQRVVHSNGNTLGKI